MKRKSFKMEIEGLLEESIPKSKHVQFVLANPKEPKASIKLMPITTVKTTHQVLDGQKFGS